MILKSDYSVRGLVLTKVHRLKTEKIRHSGKQRKKSKIKLTWISCFNAKILNYKDVLWFLQKRLPGRKRFESYESDDAGSETSSVCSERSYGSSFGRTSEVSLQIQTLFNWKFS